MISRRAGKPSWICATLFMLGLVISCLAVATWMVRFWSQRGGFTEVMSRASELPLKARLLVYAPIGLGAAAVAGLVIAFFVVKRRGWALWAAALAAPLTTVVLWQGNELLRDTEGNFYNHSRYVELYHLGAIPLAIACAGFVALLVVDVAILGRGRGRPAQEAQP